MFVGVCPSCVYRYVRSLYVGIDLCLYRYIRISVDIGCTLRYARTCLCVSCVHIWVHV